MKEAKIDLTKQLRAFYSAPSAAPILVDVPGLDQARIERFHEDLSAQIMHIEPYAAEGPTIEKLHRFITERGYALRSKHHEIYLGDPRRAAPESLKTIIRQLISPA